MCFNLYNERILPHLINWGASLPEMMDLRAEVVPFCEGDVLEVGMGSALNMQFYDSGKVRKVWGLEPSEGMRRKAQPNLAQSDIPVEWLTLPGEAIPLPDRSIDTVLLTFTACTIPDLPAAMTQMRRVLKPDGKLVFCEHGRAPEPSVQKWQDRINPIWRPLLGGCNINRPVIANIAQAGFAIEWQTSGYLESGARLAGYMSRGVAHLAG